MRLRFTTPLVLVLVMACSAPVPKTYGIYARDGRSLTDLMDEDKSRDYELSPSSSLLIFDRALADPGFNPKDAFHLYRAAYSRQVHAVHLDVPPNTALQLFNASPVPVAQVANLTASITRVGPSNRWFRTGEPIPIRVEPLGARGDMLALNPIKPLSNGPYLLELQLAGKESSVAFGVEMSGNESQRRKSACVDEFLYTVRKPAGFLGWDQWLKDVASSQSGKQKKMSEGRPVVAESTLSCDQADALKAPRVLTLTARSGPGTATSRVFTVEYELPRDAADVSIGAIGGVSTRDKQPSFTFAPVRAQPGHHTGELEVTCIMDGGARQVTTDFVQVFFFRPSERSSFYSQRLEQTNSWLTRQ